MVEKYGRKIEFARIKMKNGVVKVVGMEMRKMEEKEGLKVKNKGRCWVKVKQGSKKRRNLLEFVEKLKV